MTALDALIMAVEAGEIGDDAFCPLFHESGLCVEAGSAFSGSLDAALRLHKALLPGWHWGRQVNGAVFVSKKTQVIRVQTGSYMDIARASLLAILKAYRSTLEAAQ